MTLSKSPSFAGTLSVIFYNEVILPSIQRRKAGTEQLELRAVAESSRAATPATRCLFTGA